MIPPRLCTGLHSQGKWPLFHYSESHTLGNEHLNHVLLNVSSAPLILLRRLMNLLLNSMFCVLLVLLSCTGHNDDPMICFS